MAGRVAPAYDPTDVVGRKCVHPRCRTILPRPGRGPGSRIVGAAITVVTSSAPVAGQLYPLIAVEHTAPDGLRRGRGLGEEAAS